MRKLIIALEMCFIGLNTYAQDWVQMGSTLTDVNQKVVAVNNESYVLRFYSNVANSTAIVEIWNPNTNQWLNVPGSYNLTNGIFELNAISDGTNFYISYLDGGGYTIVSSVSISGIVTDMSTGLLNGIVNNSATLFRSKASGNLYIAGTSITGDDFNLMEYTGASWDTVEVFIGGNSGLIFSSISSISGYVTATDVYIGVAGMTGGQKLFGDGCYLFSKPVSTGFFSFAPGTPQPFPFPTSIVSLAGNYTDFPTIITNDMSASDSVHVYQYNGSNLLNLQGMQAPNPVSNVQVSATTGVPYILISTNGGVENTDVYKWNGASFQNVHPSSLGIGQVDDNSPFLVQHPRNGNPFVFSEFKIDSIGVFPLNILPTQFGSFTTNQICASSGAYWLEDFGVQDLDNDSVFLSFSSDNQTIIQDANISATNIYYSIDSSMIYFDIYISNGNPGSADITITIYDGIGSATYLATAVVVADPVVDYSILDNTPVCDLQGVTNIDALISPTGGVFNGVAIVNGLLDPQLALTDPTIYYDYEDVNGCFGLAEIVLTVFNSPVLNYGSSTSPADCGNNNGTADISVVPGSSNDYFITWSTGDTNVTTVNNLISGQYVANIIDTNGCANTITIPVQSTAFTISVNPTYPSCSGVNDGAIDITASGTGPFTYYWLSGETTEDLSNIAEGIYSVVVTDANGCSATEIVDLPAPTTSMTLDGYANDGACGMNDGGVTIFNVIGGIPNFMFQWSDGSTNQNLANVGPGIYTVTVTDGIGCQYIQDFTVSTYDGPYIEEVAVTDVSCGASDGAVDINIIAGSSSISSILWSNAEITEDISGLNVGTYTVVVTDVAGCEGQRTFSVEPVIPVDQPICMVTVDSSTTTNLLIWERATTTGISHYNIYRETGSVNNYVLVGTVNATAESAWNDVNASPLVTSWRYKLTQVDACGTESEMSMHHKTMHVAISPGIGTNYNIFWDQYEGITYSSVQLFRFDATNGLTVVATLPSNVTSYTDNPGLDTIGIDYFVGFDLPFPCVSTRATSYNGTRSNRSAGIFDPGNGVGLSVLENEDLNDLIQIYPNPNNGSFTVSFGNSIQGEKIVKVLDARGKVIVYKKTTNGKLELNLAYIESGMYFVEVLNNKNRGVKKIIKQ